MTRTPSRYAVITLDLNTVRARTKVSGDGLIQRLSVTQLSAGGSFRVHLGSGTDKDGILLSAVADGLDQVNVGDGIYVTNASQPGLTAEMLIVYEGALTFEPGN